jgi:hypothetical protein
MVEVRKHVEFREGIWVKEVTWTDNHRSTLSFIYLSAYRRKLA